MKLTAPTGGTATGVVSKDLVPHEPDGLVTVLRMNFVNLHPDLLIFLQKRPNLAVEKN
jgi:hypothetical protein